MNKLLDFLRTNASVLFPIITFILGFLSSRFTMTKKETKDLEQKLFENSKNLMLAQNDRFQDFSSVMHKYASKQGEPTLDDFYEVSTTGEKYFYQLKIISDAILANQVDKRSRDNTLIPKVREAVEKTLPSFYDTLTKISQKRGLNYTGCLKRENYESLYKVLERYN
jgi:hypothetical protein